ncbi:WD40-repeat-containing domain protein [Cyathus striatus]|nr:WD40-repeat-containing domain protein [Cyathus striatus]
MSSPIPLPTITIQPTFLTVLNEVYNGIIPSEKFWVSCYAPTLPSEHAKVLAELDEVDRERVNLSSVEGSSSVKRDSTGYEVSCASLNIPPTRIYTPVQEYHQSSKPKRITAFDISPDSTRFATGYLDGTLLLSPVTPHSTQSSTSKYPTPTQITPQSTHSSPHKSTLTHLKFFPSSRVLLSAGGDFSLSILPADLPSTQGKIDPVQTMRAHTRSVTSLGIIGVGRNVISTSLDGTVKLWDIPSKSVIGSILCPAGILCSSTDKNTSPLSSSPEAPADPREVEEVNSTVVYTGTQNGSFNFVDLASKKPIYTSPPSGVGISSIVYSHSRNLVGTGTERGLVTIYDSRSLSSPLTSFYRSEGGITGLDFVLHDSGNEGGLGISTADGLPYIANLTPSAGVKGEVVGTDCDPVRHVVRRVVSCREEVWCTGDDGIVRRYFV